MKRASMVLVLALILPGCGLWEKLTGKDEKSAKAKEQEFWKQPPPPPALPIAPEKLVSLMPKLAGWEGTPQGNVAASGQRKITSARATYQRQVDGKNQTVVIEIIDGTFSAEIYGPLARLAHGGPQDSMHKKAITIDGHSGIEEWKTDTQGMKIALNVAHRFLFTLEGTGTSSQVVAEWLQAFDLKQLAALAGPVPGAKGPQRPAQ